MVLTHQLTKNIRSDGPPLAPIASGLGIEHWWFQYFDGGKEYGRHPSHGMGMPARDLARIAYCMLHNGRMKDRQVIQNWFVEQTAAPTHKVKGLEIGHTS